jgi:hypothetical protein
MPAPLAARRYDIPLALADVVMRCLEKDPNDRPKNAGDVQRILDSADAIGGQVAARPETVTRQKWQRTSRRLWIGAALGGVAALWAWTFWPKPTPPPALTLAPTAVRVVRPTMTGADSAITLPFLNAIEASLVGAGMQVFSGTPSDAGGQLMYVVESSVQRSGDRARVNIRLIDPDPSVPVWVHQQDFAIDSVFAAQDQVAGRVSDAVAQVQSRRRG